MPTNEIIRLAYVCLSEGRRDDAITYVCTIDPHNDVDYMDIINAFCDALNS